MTHVDESSGEVLALIGELLELLNQCVRVVRRGLNDGAGSSAEGRVDLGSPVDDVLDDGRGLLEEGCNSLDVSVLALGHPRLRIIELGVNGSQHHRRPWTA